jgi:trehalose-6-phosphatase
MQITDLDDLNWIPKVKKIMKSYSDNIDGSFVEERESYIQWNYKNAENEHGTGFLYDISDYIEKVLKGTNTKIVLGNGYLKVKPLGIKLNKVIDMLLEKIISHSLIDFIFYLGNG